MVPGAAGTVNRAEAVCYYRDTLSRWPTEAGTKAVLDNWLQRWKDGRTGWHEADGNVMLRRHWPRLMRGSRVLVPLCGKTVDMLWLARQGLDVTGVEVSEIAIREFFDEHGLAYRLSSGDGLPSYSAVDVPVKIVCGDYMSFDDGPFHSLYDRGALVAVAAADRPAYVQHTRRLLEADAYRLIITLNYDDARAAGPPHSVSDTELLGYWSDLQCVESRNDIERSPPKFRQAGLDEVIESVWIPR